MRLLIFLAMGGFCLNIGRLARENAACKTGAPSLFAPLRVPLFLLICLYTKAVFNNE